MLIEDTRTSAEYEREIMADDNVGEFDTVVARYLSARRLSAFL